jgi:glutathione S-transferase
MRKKVPETMAACFELIEREFLQGPWVLGERMSVSDAYLFTLARWLEGDGVDPARFPRVAEHMQRMKALPAVSKVLAAQGA